MPNDHALSSDFEVVIAPWEPGGDSFPDFAQAYRWWRTHVDAGRLPSRSDFDPASNRSLLARIVLFDVVRDQRGVDFRYRLWGSEITTLVGKDYTGRLHGEVVAPEAMEFGRRCFFWMIEHRLCQVARQRVPFENREFLTYERLGLPLSSNGAEIDQIMLVVRPWKPVHGIDGTLRLMPHLS